MTESLRVKLNAGSEVGGVSDPFECEGKREAIREKGRVAKQLDKGLKGRERVGRVRE